MQPQDQPARLSAGTAPAEPSPLDRPRQQGIITAVVAVTFTGFDFCTPFLPLYITMLGVPDLAQAALWAGWVIGISPFMSGLSAPIWGVLADRFGQKISVVRALTAYTIISFLMGIVITPVELFGLRLLFGLAGGFSALMLALASANTPKALLGQAVGRFQVAQALPLVFAPVLGGWIIDRIGMRFNFVLSSLLILGVLIVFALRYQDTPRVVEKPSKAASRPSVGIRELILQRRMLPIFGILFAVNFVDNSLMPMLPLLVLSLHGQAGQIATLIGLIVASGPIAMAAASFAMGRLLSGKIKPWQFMVVALPAGAVACLGLVAATDVVQVMILRALLGLLYGGLATVAFTAGGLAVPQERTSTFFGAMASAQSMGRALGPIVGGTIAAANFRMVFVLDAVLYLVVLVAVVLWFRPAGKPQSTVTATA